MDGASVSHRQMIRKLDESGIKVKSLYFMRVLLDSQLELLMNLWPSVRTSYAPSSVNAPFYGYSKLHCKFKRSVSAPKCRFSSMAPEADLALRGSILSSGAISTPIKTVPAPSKTDSAHSGR